jgi:hypothetical protein
VAPPEARMRVTQLADDGTAVEVTCGKARLVTTLRPFPAQPKRRARPGCGFKSRCAQCGDTRPQLRDWSRQTELASVERSAR